MTVANLIQAHDQAIAKGFDRDAENIADQIERDCDESLFDVARKSGWSDESVEDIFEAADLAPCMAFPYPFGLREVFRALDDAAKNGHLMSQTALKALEAQHAYRWSES